ncbi:MAG: hypothetical protein HY308_17485 [Gammaproteobacteria bacterium]|nr:hypothetical protein [Gammaproteobacteria bacterium]
MNVNLHIERLLLEGLDLSARDGDVVNAALQHELVRLIGAGALSLPQSFNVASLRAAPIRLNADAGAVEVGEGVAQTLYGELSPKASS